MLKIPKEVELVVAELEKHGFQAYVVGGCVRDLLLGKEPEDWDVATSAKPEEVQKIFPENFYENKFFTVTVQTKSENPKLKEIEVTTFRADFEYGDRRRPGRVEYAKTIEEDLSRRDFTVNAIALRQKKIIDPFQGQKDLQAKLIRAVGNAHDRLTEDALRMMRAVRLATVLNFDIEKKTKEAIQKCAELLKEISAERVRDEFRKIIMSDHAKEGVELLCNLGLLQYIMPELQEGYGVAQNKHHKYTVWEHNLLSLDYAAKQKWNFAVRLAALLHDVAKPRVKQGTGPDATFYNHEIVGAKMAKAMLSRLKFPSKDIEKITKLIRYHMFYYNVDEVSESSVRRLVRKVGQEHMDDLLKLRMADRIGSGVPKAEPYKLRHWQYMIEKVSRDPLSVTMLKVNGKDIMEMLGIAPGPRIGWLLQILFGEVLDDPKKNERLYLEKRLKELHGLGDRELQKLAQSAKEEMERIEQSTDEIVKQKYFVK
jgi:poly(A) polymerase/tRNA nucleotidyltransferase (CCA-adding enzyme)